MMKFGITGTRKIPNVAAEEIICKELLSHDWEADEFTSGAAHGVDSLAAKFVYLILPRGVVNRVVIPYGDHNTQCSTLWASEVIIPSAYIQENHYDYNSSKAYRQRNKEILKHSDKLLAFPKSSKEEQRSGTWMTIRMAIKQNIPVKVIPINGDETYSL